MPQASLAWLLDVVVNQYIAKWCIVINNVPIVSSIILVAITHDYVVELSEKGVWFRVVVVIFHNILTDAYSKASTKNT